MKLGRLQPFAALPFAVLHRPDDPRVVTLPVPGYRQVKNYSCGFATALMVARHFGIGLARAELYALLGTSYWGTSQTALVRGLRQLGLRANVRYDVDFDRLTTALDRGKLVIGYLEDDEHWLVVYGYGREPERVFVADPRPNQDCEQRWERYGRRLGGFGIICSQPRVPASAVVDALAAPEPAAREASAAPEPAARESSATPEPAQEAPRGQLALDFGD